MKTINELLTMSQTQVYNYVKDIVVNSGFSNTVTKEYIIFNSIKDKPMLCVHLDTINTRLKTEKLVVVKEDNGVLSLDSKSKASCLGGDDRCGVFIALSILKSIISGSINSNAYSIGFFCDEESGGIGSSVFIDRLLSLDDDSCEVPTALIGIDRRNTTQGIPEVATYGYDNKALIALATNGGYTEDYGSFTDASNIAGEINIACINLSVGYNYEHTNREVIYTDDMYYTLEFLRTLPFGNLSYPHEDKKDYYENPNKPCVCDYCGEHSLLYWEGSLMLCESCMTMDYSTRGGTWYEN